MLGFPCNQFHEQDPGSNEEIQEFCTRNYGVSFPLFAKTQVKGPDALPLFQYLVKEKGFRGFDEGHSLTGVLDDILAKDDPDYQDKPDIKWNFTKFVISRDGRVMARLEPTASPNSCSGLIESLLS